MDRCYTVQFQGRVAYPHIYILLSIVIGIRVRDARLVVTWPSTPPVTCTLNRGATLGGRVRADDSAPHVSQPTTSATTRSIRTGVRPPPPIAATYQLYSANALYDGFFFFSHSPPLFQHNNASNSASPPRSTAATNTPIRHYYNPPDRCKFFFPSVIRPLVVRFILCYTQCKMSERYA